MASLPPPVSPELKGNPAGKMVYTVQLPDGSEADIEGPANATPEQLQTFVQQQSGAAPLVDSSQNVVHWPGDAGPREAATRMDPEDEQQLLHILQTGSADDARRFAASKGFAGPDNFDEVVAARDKGAGVDKNVVYHLPKPAGGKTMEAPGAWARGVGDTASLGFLDELGAVADSLGATKGRESVWNSDKSFGDLYDRNLDINRGILDADEADHPDARIAGQIIGGLAIPSGLEGVGLNAGKSVLRAGGTLREARAAAAAAVRNRMIAVGAGGGAAHGVGSGEDAEGRLAGAVEQGAMGFAAGGVAGKISEAVTPRIAAKAAAARAAGPTAGQEVVQAADRLNITPFAPDVGGPGTRRTASAVAQSITGVQPLAAAANRTVDEAKAARDRIAASIGEALRPEAAGQSALSGAQKAIVQTRNAARAFYGRAEREADGLTVPPTNALAAVDNHIAELSQTPGGAPGLSTLQALRDDLAKGNVSVTGIRNMRTVLRDQFVKEGLRGSDIERRVNEVVDGAAQDVSDGLSAAGKGEAATNFARGDAAWRQRAQTIDTVFRPLIGTRDNPKSGEQIIKTLTADLQGNNARAVKFLNALPPEEQDNLRASIIGGLGRASAGTQNSEGDAFSLPTFLTQWNHIGESAKSAYFGPEARAALNDLAKVAQGSKEAQKFANHSNTAGAAFGNVIFTALAQGVGGVKTAGTSLVAPYALGRLLASPRFARWVARAPKTTLSTPAYLDRLGRIARAEPGIANEVLQLQQRLSQAFGSVPTRAAADKSLDHGSGVDGDNQQ